MATSTVQAVPKLYDVIMWLMGRVEKFPRSQKFTLGDRILNISLDTLDVLIRPYNDLTERCQITPRSEVESEVV